MWRILSSRSFKFFIWVIIFSYKFKRIADFRVHFIRCQAFLNNMSQTCQWVSVLFLMLVGFIGLLRKSKAISQNVLSNETRDILTPSCYVSGKFLRIVDFCFYHSERSEAFTSKKRNQEASLFSALPKGCLTVSSGCQKLY